MNVIFNILIWLTRRQFNSVCSASAIHEINKLIHLYLDLSWKSWCKWLSFQAWTCSWVHRTRTEDKGEGSQFPWNDVTSRNEEVWGNPSHKQSPAGLVNLNISLKTYVSHTLPFHLLHFPPFSLILFLWNFQPVTLCVSFSQHLPTSTRSVGRAGCAHFYCLLCLNMKYLTMRCRPERWMISC